MIDWGYRNAPECKEEELVMLAWGAEGSRRCTASASGGTFDCEVLVLLVSPDLQAGARVLGTLLVPFQKITQFVYGLTVPVEDDIFFS